MALTLRELLAEQTEEDFLALLLLAYQGVGFVRKEGVGSGTLTASGVAAVESSVRVKISASGTLGTGTFQLSTDGGVVYGSAITIPLGGTYSVSGTGLTITFVPGATGSGDSFVIGDLYSIELTLPTLPVTAWQEGQTALTITEMVAMAAASLGRAVYSIAQGGLLDYAEGGWLDLILENVYGLSRRTGTVNAGNILLTDPSGSGPHTITAGQLWVGTTGGLRWTNTAGGTLPKNGELSLPVRAEAIGSQYNVGAGTISVLFTSLPGVVVNNPNPVGGSWITTSGADRETDGAARARAKLKWPALGVGAVAEAYDLWAKTASTNVNRTLVRPHPSIEGRIDIYLASSSGTVDGSTISAVDDYVQPRVPLTVTAVVASAVAQAYTVEATVYVTTGYEASVAAAIATNLAALNGGGVNSIGEALPGVPIGGTLYLTEIIEQLQLPAGVRNVVLVSPASDLVLDPTEVAVLTQDITITGI